MNNLKVKHMIEERMIFPAWFKATINCRKKIVAILAKKQAEEIINQARICL